MRHSAFYVALLAIATIWPASSRAGEQEDKRFAQQIAGVLRTSGRVKNYSIGVKCQDGTVWLAGRVTSQAQMDSAIDVVQNVDGVEQIVNNLDVPANDVPEAPVAAAIPRAGGAMPVAQQAAVQLVWASPPVPAIAPARGGRQNVPAGYARLAGHGGASHGGTTHGGSAYGGVPQGGAGRPIPAYAPVPGGGIAPATYDQPHMPNYAWPSYAPYPNYASLTYPRQHSPTAWPFIGPFYPYPQVPMGWRKVSLEWDDGWWFLDFQDRGSH